MVMVIVIMVIVIMIVVVMMPIRPVYMAVVNFLRRSFTHIFNLYGKEQIYTGHGVVEVYQYLFFPYFRDGTIQEVPFFVAQRNGLARYQHIFGELAFKHKYGKGQRSEGIRILVAISLCSWYAER